MPHHASPQAAVRAYLGERPAGDPRWERLREAGSWGDVRHTGRVARKAEKLLYCIDPEPGACYRNAVDAALNAPEDVRYVEGVAVPGEDGTPTEHAWVQVDGAVLELTWAERADVPLPPEDAAYYGVGVDRDRLRGLDRERGRGEPLLPALAD